MTTHQSNSHPHPANSSGRLQPGTKVQVGQYIVQIEKFLSEGGFAHVYVASLVSPSSVDGFSPSQNQFVLKRMAVPDKAGLVEVRKEVDVMKQLRPHKHIVYFIEASASSIPGSSGYEIFILMEWCPGGGIIDLLNSRLQNRLTESEILKIFSDTVEAVAHMHSQNPILIHRDLKVENILVASPNLYKLCDFGSTTSPLPRPPQTSAEIISLEADLNKHTTLQYRAPEMVDVWSRKGVTEKADIWALGVFLYKLCYYTTPFEAHGPLAIVNVQYQIPSYPAYSNSIKYLIGTMLQELAQSRPDVWEVHQHVCKLRGTTPHLIRPKRKQLPSNGPDSLVSSNLAHPKQQSKLSSENNLDSIFTTAPVPSTPQTYQQIEPIVPMRRGRPVTKSKPFGGITGSNDNSFWESVNSTVLDSNSVTGKNTSPPEESDLFAREAAAGFGDDFLSSTPQFTSFKPNIQQKPIDTVVTKLPAPPSQFKPSASKPQIHSKPKIEPSSAFEDLVPSRKKSPPKTLNEIRNNLPRVNSAVTGPVSGTSQSSNQVLPLMASNVKFPQYNQGPPGEKLLQKTGPNAIYSRVSQTAAYRTISITQKTGPAIASGVNTVLSQPKPPLSDWFVKDQAKLVSRSTQTSPSLLKSLVAELTSGAPLNKFHGNKLHVESNHATRANPEIMNSGSNLQATFKLNPTSKTVSNVPKSLSSSSIPSLERKSNQNFLYAQHKASASSDSDEEPEDPEGLKGYRAQAQSILSSNKPLLGKNAVTESDFTKHIIEHSPMVQLSPRSSHADNPGAHETNVTLPNQTSPSSSSTGLSSSEAMTEEDEATKLKRRAAIAKFAPSAKAGESKITSNQISRDPFSSRARSRSVSPEPADILSKAMAIEPIKKQVAPPLRAPRPQSLKSAAAINNLVSRYENLSTSASDSTSCNKSSSTVIGFKKKQTIFKPVTSISNLTNDKVNYSVTENPTSTAFKSSVHIPKKSLGPGVISSQAKDPPIPLAVDSVDQKILEEGQDEEEKFTSVNDMKSKWESGAVQTSKHPKDRRLPRADYGQT